MQNAAEDFYTCSICLEYFIEPKCLPCLHNFCATCLKPLLLGSPSFSCPLCQATTEFDREKGVESFKTNFYVKELMASLTKGRNSSTVEKVGMCTSCLLDNQVIIGRCRDCCAFLCRACEHAHRSTKLTGMHSIRMFTPVVDNKKVVAEKVSSTGKFYGSEMCKTHTGKKLVTVCVDCSQVFCSYCLLDKESNAHKDHTLLGIEEARKSCLQQFSESKAKYECAVAEMRGICDDMIAQEKMLPTSKTEILQRCKREYEELLNRFMENSLANLESEIVEQFKMEAKRLRQMKTKVDAVVKSLAQNQNWFLVCEEESRSLVQLIDTNRQQEKILKDFEKLRKQFDRHCLMIAQNVDSLVEKKVTSLSVNLENLL